MQNNSTLAAVLAESKQLQTKIQNTESEYQAVLNQLQTFQQQMQSLGAVAHDLTITEIERQVTEIIRRNGAWDFPHLIVHATPINDEWWRITFYLQEGDEVAQVPNQPGQHPGYFWSFDPKFDMSHLQRSVGTGTLARWSGGVVPKISRDGGVRGSVVVSVITGASHITLDRTVEFAPLPEIPAEAAASEAQGEAAPADAAGQ